MEVTNNDSGELEIRNGEFEDAPLWLPAPGTVAAGTILCRPTEIPVVDEEVTVDADEGNTGNGTVEAIVVGVEPVVGVYTLTCTAEAAHGGTFELRGPGDELIANDLVMDAGAGASTVFARGGFMITITDGSDDFDTEDTFELTVAATGAPNTEAVAPFEIGGPDGFGVPKFVLPYDVVVGSEKRVTVTASDGNTGDGTVAATITGDVMLGHYVLECESEVANGGVFSLTDPFGDEIADITMTPGAGGVTVVSVGGFRLEITDGTEDFDDGDIFTIAVREHAATKGVRALCAGEVARGRLVVHADGDGSSLTAAHYDALRDYVIVSTEVQQLSALDNQ